MEINKLTAVIVSLFAVGILIIVTLLFFTSFNENAFEQDSNSSTQFILTDNGTSTTLTLSDSDATITSSLFTSKNQTWLEFDGEDDNISLSFLGDLNLHNESYTISIWSNSTGDLFFLGMGDNDDYIRCISDLCVLEDTLDNEIIMEFDNSNGKLKNWSNMVFVFDNETTGDVRLYRNGVLENTTTNTFTDVFDLNYLGLSKSGEYHEGQFDDFRIYEGVQYNESDVLRIYEERSKGIPIPILNFHSISGGSSSSTMNESNFNETIIWLNKSGFETITYQNFYDYTQNNFNMPKKPIILSIDDGPTSAIEFVAPLLQDYGYIASVAIITNSSEYEVGSAMSWENVSTLYNTYGWEIVSHSFTHPLFRSDNIGEINATIQFNQSRQDIIDNIGVIPTTFVYPSGNTNTTYDDICKDYYNICLSQGVVLPNHDYTYKDKNLTYELDGIVRMQIRNTTIVSDLYNIDRYNNLTLWWKLSENSGTTAYDVSGNGNNGTISGASWNNDGVDVPLTQNTDYTLLGAIFKVINPDYAWTGINGSWDYLYDSTSQDAVQDMQGGFLDFIPWIGIILLVVAAAIVLYLVITSFANKRV